jgi:caa(3)-type oxidase subunit IV
MSNHTVHTPTYYLKIWAVLLVLLVISICGPMAEIRWLTLITAFGIAGVKAYLVASKFMHLDVEKTYISYLLLSMVLMMVLLYAGVSPDIQMGKGHNWEIESQFEKTEESKDAWCIKWGCPSDLTYCENKCDNPTDSPDSH